MRCWERASDDSCFSTYQPAASADEAQDGAEEKEVEAEEKEDEAEEEEKEEEEAAE